MQKKYDILVIGSGLGGLCASLECLRMGKKVLLIEQHNLPGGYASSFVRGRFEFEPALHEMPDMRSPTAITGVAGYLKENAGLDVDFLPIPEAYRVILTEKGVNERLPFGWDDFIDTIEKAVPGSRPALERYKELCKEIQGAFSYLSSHQTKPDYPYVLKEYGDFIRSGSATAQRIADELKIPLEAQDLLNPYWCYLGVPMNRLSFSIWASLLDSYISHPAVIPRMRSHELSSAFLQKIYDLGGDVRFNCAVTSIDVAKRQVHSVSLSSGESISCDRVISNASPSNVFNNLIKPEREVPLKARKNIQSRIHGFSLVVVYLGLDASKEELGLEDYSYFIAPHMDTPSLYDAIFDLDSENIMQASVCLNAAIPDCSPPGTTILSISAGFRAEAWEKVSEEEYFRLKDRIADRLIRQFEEATGSSIRPHIEEIEIAAPQTFSRYTGAYNGIVYGYEPEPWDGIVPRALAQDKENYIEGLEFCGGFSFRCHGYGSSIMSGKNAAERTCRKMEEEA